MRVLDSHSTGTHSLGQFKQELIKDYNEVNHRLFGIGVVRQKVDVLGDKILIVALHKRVPSLAYLSALNSNVSELADHYLIKGFKNEFKQLLVEKYGFEIVSIFKDYDAQAELSATVVLLKRDVRDYL
ncbi:Na-translocating system protein MpsC family protein [Billgrantia lactosivorans]|uniref:Na-translocating system protein MpsC family protein n=1 Tax=Billgrantia lactosivorans TaxID=2185141 RepID=UPI000DABF2BC|nr:Na-translocating system protein MpsC family protein [Halomonas lactosivorans]